MQANFRGLLLVLGPIALVVVGLMVFGRGIQESKDGLTPEQRLMVDKVNEGFRNTVVHAVADSVRIVLVLSREHTYKEDVFHRGERVAWGKGDWFVLMLNQQLVLYLRRHTGEWLVDGNWIAREGRKRTDPPDVKLSMVLREGEWGAGDIRFVLGNKWDCERVTAPLVR